MSEPVDKDALIAQLQSENQALKAQNELQKQELKLQKEKIDLLIRRIFGAKTEQLDSAQLELLLKAANDTGKAEASVAPSAEAVTTVKKTTKKTQRRRERWPTDLPVECEFIDPEEVAADPEGYRCIGQEVSEKLDYQPARFFRRQLSPAQICLALRTGLSADCGAFTGDFAGTLYRRTGAAGADYRRQVQPTFTTLPAGADLLVTSQGVVASS